MRTRKSKVQLGWDTANIQVKCGYVEILLFYIAWGEGLLKKKLRRKWPKIASAALLQVKTTEKKLCQLRPVPGTNTRQEQMPSLEKERAFMLVVCWSLNARHIWHNWTWRASKWGLPKTVQTSLCCLTYTVVLMMIHEALSTGMLPVEKYKI